METIMPGYVAALLKNDSYLEAPKNIKLIETQ